MRDLAATAGRVAMWASYCSPGKKPLKRLGFSGYCMTFLHNKPSFYRRLFFTPTMQFRDDRIKLFCRYMTNTYGMLVRFRIRHAEHGTYMYLEILEMER